MNETVQAEVLEEDGQDEGVVALESSPVPQADTERDSDEVETRSSDDARLTGTALLKSLLSTSTASSVAVAEKMITTTEVTDEKLNLKKILYQPDKEKKDDKEQNGQLNISDPTNDDDDRLIIDISDEERGTNGEGKTNGRMSRTREGEKKAHRMAVLEESPAKQIDRHISRSQENDLPTSITYSLEPSQYTGISSSFKIDILTPTLNQSDSTTDKIVRSTSYQSPPKSSKTMSSLDELNVISHEIDKQITKKTIAILELLKEYLSGLLEKNVFLARMSDASDTSLSDLISIARKLTKRHKFEPNPNHKEFMRIKFLQFPTTSRDLVIYFDNLLPSLNRDKFISMIKFYEIIIKEMLNLNKTKILQYLLDFMIMRKNTQLDLLNYNYQITSAPNLKQADTSTAKFQLADSTQNNPSERKSMKLHDTTYNFIIRSDPIYLQAGSSFVTNHRNVITCRVSSRIQVRSFERRPFDNNILKGRRIGRRLVRSPEDEKAQLELVRANFSLSQQNELGTTTVPRSTTPIIVESDTPPPSLPSEPPSPPQQKTSRPQQTLFVQKANVSEASSNNVVNGQTPTRQEHVNQHSLKRKASIRNVDQAAGEHSRDPLQNGQITIQEIQTLSQNGTEIIPTSILKTTIMNRHSTAEQERTDVAKTDERGVAVVKKILPRVLSHEGQEKPPPAEVKLAPKRRQSCHERIMMPVSENEEKTIENSAIGRNYMEFLHAYEKELKKTSKHLEIQQQGLQQQRPQKLNFYQGPPPHHLQQKRVRFSEVEEDGSRSPRSHHQAQVNYSQHQQMERFPPLQFLPGSSMRSPIKSQPPLINYQFYQHQFERELRERGLDHRFESDPNRPMELVSHILPERYHQQEQQQRTHYTSQAAPKPARQETSPRSQQQRNAQHHAEAQQSAMMAAAYQQLQSLHRDPNTLSPQQYAEHLKQLDHLKNLQPSAFTAFAAYHRAPPQPDQRQPDYYANTQEAREKVTQSSPHHYQISSSSSREDSPTNYDLMKQDESLQRKLKSKAKSSTYIEPNQLTKPFFNPAHSTYYSEPFALTKPKQAVSSSPPEAVKPSTAFHPPDAQRSRSPRAFIDPNSSMKHYQWVVAHAQTMGAQQPHQLPQRPIARPPVPAFIEAKPNSSQHRPMTFQEHPTEFLRNYYAAASQQKFN